MTTRKKKQHHHLCVGIIISPNTTLDDALLTGRWKKTASFKPVRKEYRKTALEINILTAQSRFQFLWHAFERLCIFDTVTTDHNTLYNLRKERCNNSSRLLISQNGFLAINIKFIIFSEYAYDRSPEEGVGCKDQADFSRWRPQMRVKT
jgi:hypothetical protein